LELQSWIAYMETPICILCENQNTETFYEDQAQPFERTYYQCADCQLIFVDPTDFPSRTEEKGRYDNHQNYPEDERYRNFLRQLFDPLNELLPPESKGLDFGSGPGPTINLMFEAEGHSVTLYDPFYAHRPDALEQSYDFITATEVVEHLHHPARQLHSLWSCLRPGGYLGIMTLLAEPDLSPARFANWHYRRDPTHVCFYSWETFEWLARQWNAELTFHGNRVIIMQKPNL